VARRLGIHAALIRRRRSHADRLIGLLDDRGEPVHLDDIQACLGMSQGETSYYDRGERSADAGAAESARTGDTERPFKTDRSGRWSLRFR